MKVLLIGGNRFVGVEILWHLLREGHELTVLAIDAPPPDTRAHIRWLHADRNDEALMATLFGDSHFDVVVDNIAYEPRHVESLTKVLSGRVGRYVLTSTTDGYPHNFPRTYTEEQTEIREFDLAGLNETERYSCGKRACEAVLMRSGIPWTVLRPCVVTGPRDNRAGAPAPRMIHWFESSARSHFWVPRILDGGPLILCSQDEVVLKQIWVGDLARAVVHVIARPDCAGQAYNVTGDELWTNARMVHALARAAGAEPEVVYVPNALIDRAGLDYAPAYGTGSGWTVADNSKLKATGWRPTQAEAWLPFLLEANSPPDARAWYHTRLQEIALARHVQRHQRQRAQIAPPLPAPLSRFDGSIQSGATCTIAGRLEEKASRSFQTRALAQKAGVCPADAFFKNFSGAHISGIGIGTWMGDLSGATDVRYTDTLVHAASRGINVFDTAINYRHMKAERCVGAMVRRLAALGISRGALCIATKGGFVTHDADDHRPADVYLREEYLSTGLLDEHELARRHAINPEFIAHQFEKSLANLGLTTVDIYYLHNPEELIPHIGAEEFRRRLCATFAVLEGKVADGKLGGYGLATWHGLRIKPDAPCHLSLELAIAAASDAAAAVGQKQHHLQALQLPFNVRDHEALTKPTQQIEGTLLPALEAAEKLGLYCFTSASVLQGSHVPHSHVASLCEALPGHLAHTAALQAARSAPGVGTALAGMRRITSVEEAMAVASQPLLPKSFWRKIAEQ